MPPKKASRKGAGSATSSRSRSTKPTAPVKPVAAIKKQAAAAKATASKKVVAKQAAAPKTTATKKAAAEQPAKNNTVTKAPAKAVAKATKAVEKKPAASNKRKTADASDVEPAAKRARSKAYTPSAAVVSEDEAVTIKKAVATATKKAPATRKAPATMKGPATKQAAVSKPPPKKKFGPALNIIPTTKFDVYVCGEGSAGELGLGAMKFQGKGPIDVKRPRLNHLLSAKTVGVVSLTVGGMHCAALTHDNKILTWGVNDQGALGRETSSEGKMKDITKADGSESDSDDDDDDSGLNPSESEPREVDYKHFPEGTMFTGLVASDSATFVITEEGLVYGWGTFRGNDGLLGFRGDKDIQRTPILIPELKQITDLAAGTNHILALNKNGKVFAWGAGEQNQLARRVVQRTAAGALIPREFGLKGQTVHIACGNYHSFAINQDGTVRAWGLNSWGECGVSREGKGADDDIVNNPTVVESLKGFSVKQIDGGGHHSIAVTESGQVLTWGRIDLSQGGMEPSKFPKDLVFFDDDGKPRYLEKPAVIPNIKGEYVSASTDGCLVVTKEGKAYSWGFSTNYQTGQGDLDDVREATLIDNSAVRGKKLVWAGAGGQFSIFCAEAEDVPMSDA